MFNWEKKKKKVVFFPFLFSTHHIHAQNLFFSDFSRRTYVTHANLLAYRNLLCVCVFRVQTSLSFHQKYRFTLIDVSPFQFYISSIFLFFIFFNLGLIFFYLLVYLLIYKWHGTNFYQFKFNPITISEQITWLCLKMSDKKNTLTGSPFLYLSGEEWSEIIWIFLTKFKYELVYYNSDE